MRSFEFSLDNFSNQGLGAVWSFLANAEVSDDAYCTANPSGGGNTTTLRGLNATFAESLPSGKSARIKKLSATAEIKISIADAGSFKSVKMLMAGDEATGNELSTGAKIPTGETVFQWDDAFAPGEILLVSSLDTAQLGVDFQCKSDTPGSPTISLDRLAGYIHTIERNQTLGHDRPFRRAHGGFRGMQGWR